jgi:hypothetical protein
MVQAESERGTSHIVRWCQGRLSIPAEECLSLDVESLLESYLTERPFPPVDVEFLARRRKCRIEQSSFARHVSGLLVPVPNGFVLRLNDQGPNRNKKRLRFTIAHEIAHTFFYRFHPDGRPEEICGSLSSFQQEVLCDFAAQRILVPRQLLLSSPLLSASKAKLELIDAISQVFEASSEVAARSLKEQGGAFTDVGLCEWVAETIYVRTRRTAFSQNDRFAPLVLTWMIPPTPVSDIAPPRGSRLLANSSVWELCCDRRGSVEGSEIRLGTRFLARLGAALVHKVNGKTLRVLASITKLAEAGNAFSSVGPRSLKYPAGAQRRECPLCRQAFRPMTDAQWRNVWQLHEKLSIRHQRACGHHPFPTPKLS